MKNDTVGLKNILAIPGVDVNVQDHYGWTPLHEAANHGHLECVQLLLDYKPQFVKEIGVLNKICDISQTNEEGLTSLHDAVQNNHISVVHLLLKRGGGRLLLDKTSSGCTPFDLAETDAMREALCSLRSNQTDSHQECMYGGRLTNL